MIIEYPYRLGGGGLPESRRDQFKDEEHEYLVAVSDEDVSFGEMSEGRFYASIAIIGAVDLTTGEREKGRTIMIWEPTAEERQNDAYKYFFCGLRIYRVKGHPPVKPWYRSPAVCMGGMYVTEITKTGVIDRYLSGVVRDYWDSLFLHSELFDTLELTDEDDGYTGRFNWLGTEIKVTVSIEYTPYTNPLSYLEAFCRDCERHDEELRRFAAENLEGGEEAAREMQLEEIYMYYDGDYDAYFRYRDHTVDIDGDRDGPKKLWIYEE